MDDDIRIVYYVTPDGAIKHFHKAPEGKTDDWLDEEMKKYNAKPENASKARLAHLKAGSIERYFYDYAMMRVKYTRESVEAAREAISDALDCVNSLEVAEP